MKEAATYLSISPKKLRRLVQDEQLPIIADEGAPWLLDIRDLDTWIERHKQIGTV